jgi:heme-degrading monooxygenase HmoA
MFISVNTIETKEKERTKEMFRHAAPHLKHFKGFMGFEMWETEESLLAVAKWDSRESFDEYTNSEMFKRHHPNGEKASANSEVLLYTGEVMA